MCTLENGKELWNGMYIDKNIFNSNWLYLCLSVFVIPTKNTKYSFYRKIQFSSWNIIQNTYPQSEKLRFGKGMISVQKIFFSLHFHKSFGWHLAVVKLSYCPNCQRKNISCFTYWLAVTFLAQFQLWDHIALDGPKRQINLIQSVPKK